MSHSHEHSQEFDLQCSNCDDGCVAVTLCPGCEEVVCRWCYDEHNNDAPCHVPDEPEDSLSHTQEPQTGMQDVMVVRNNQLVAKEYAQEQADKLGA